MIEYKEIDYLGAKIKVSQNGDIIWNNTKRNIYYNKDGYSVCSVKIPDKGWRSVRVARLVSIAYIPNPNNLPEVNHKDYNRTNSNVNNLEWITRRDNVVYSNCNRPDVTGVNNPNFGNRKLSKIYSENKEYALEKQSRKGLRNGRCRKIKVYENNKLISSFNYINDCCEFIRKNYSSNTTRLDSIRSQIDKSIRNDRLYKGLKFVKD